MAHELPKLPESYRSFWTREDGGYYRESAPHYSADQMRAYATAHAASLEAEVARLRLALEDMLAGWKYIRSFHGDLYGVGWDRAQSKAEAALNRAALEGS